MTVTPADLALVGDIANIDTARAQRIIDLATALCQTIVTPLPSAADSVVLDVSLRAYVNPQGVMQETVGPYSVSRSGASGVTLTRANRATLKRLAGRGSAFTINPTPTTAGTDSLPVYDVDPSL